LVTIMESDDPVAIEPLLDRSRVQALLCTAPLHELQASRNQRGGLWSDLDCYDVALETIDKVVDTMGFDVGCDQAELESHVAGFIARRTPDTDPDEVADVAHVIVELLIRPRRSAYTDDRRRPFDFALLREHPAAAGTYLTATNEAINVLVGALDTDVASAQAAAEAQLQNLLRRNRLREAAAVAGAARIRSIQYGMEVRKVISDTRRDVRRAGWSGDVPARLAEIRAHLTERVELERRMLASLRDRLVESERPDLAAHASRLIETVSECLNRHRELHNVVLEAEEAFYVEQHRQAFLPQTFLRSVDVIDEVVAPVLQGTLGGMHAVISAFAEATLGPRAPRIGRLDAVLAMLLADPRQVDSQGAPVSDVQLQDRADDPRLLSDEARKVADALFADLDTPARLSTLLVAARSSGVAGAVDVVALRALAAFDPDLAHLRVGDRILAAVDDGTLLNDDDWRGTDLLVGIVVADGERLAAAARVAEESGAHDR
jgi:hypothetical protein